MAAPRRLHLNLNFLSAGSHAAAWLWPGNRPDAFVDPTYVVETARLAERGTFDAVFLADHPSMPARSDLRPFQALEPSIVLTAIAGATSHIGLIGTISSSYNAPWNIARRFASLDIISGGRAGINIVTTADRTAAFNFGSEAAADHATRYDRAVEFTDVLKALWNSWQDDALVGDKATGVFIDRARVNPAHHHGRYFQVQGALNVPRSRQGHPVILQAGGSDDGLELAARHAEAVFTAAHTPEDSLTYAHRLRARAEALGRPPGSVLVLPGLVTIIGGTETEAQRREEELNALTSTEQGVTWISGLLQIDASRYDLDAPAAGRPGRAGGRHDDVCQRRTGQGPASETHLAPAHPVAGWRRQQPPRHRRHARADRRIDRDLVPQRCSRRFQRYARCAAVRAGSLCRPGCSAAAAARDFPRNLRGRNVT